MENKQTLTCKSSTRSDIFITEDNTLCCITGNNGSHKCDTFLQYFNSSPEFDVLTLSSYPAVPKEHGVLCRGFRGYRINLMPFKGMFCEIHFRGCGNGGHVVCGYVIDKEGNIESVATRPYDDNGNAVLPLTSISHALYASVPLKNGKPIWDSITVQFVSCVHHMVTLPVKVIC